ncbi:hypothetical protein KZZ52_32125 [Dactylosporangium sp. AC04546]|uniref:hypothetical protein n=1 Tax=Dactylosporangium sp. AC04546 TaxID=2862460 RepID=UPI001EDF8C1C|nr:hypothetical protein [Dactylosporangium sp. AC04546]WVK78638.1 hypothetical protein KZZ52_32125 [Dactylosporangium sp. AC04546]
MPAGVVVVELVAFLIVLLVVAILSSGSAWIARRRSREPPGSLQGERAEAVLTAWLLAGYLSAEEYRRDMAILAAREAHHDPPLTPLDP